MRQVTLHIPGLTGPQAPLTDSDLPDLPALQFLLGRARRTRRPATANAQLAGLMGLEAEADRDLPVAAVTRLIDAEDRPDGIWMRADPVHLSPDRDRLLLLDASVFNVSQHDALAVATEVQKVLDADAWRLEVPFHDRWYIKLPAMPGITTTELAGVAGRDINPRLPQGDEARVWHRLLNEIQMQLHDSDINKDREARGELPINSLWFWGIGALPAIPPRYWSAVYGDDCFLEGLAMLSMTPYRETPSDADALLDDLPDHAHVLVQLEHCRRAACYADLGRWVEGLEALEQHWFAPLLQALRDKRLQQLTLCADGRAFSVTRPALYKFWRRPRSPLRFARHNEGDRA